MFKTLVTIAGYLAPLITLFLCYIIISFFEGSYNIFEWWLVRTIVGNVILFFMLFTQARAIILYFNSMKELLNNIK